MLPAFVTVAELRALQGSSATGGGAASDRNGELVLADVRWSLDGSEGFDRYLSGHLPGAVFVDLDTDLAAPPSRRGGRHPLPDPEHFAAALGARGIAGTDRVVAYDTAGGAVAARLVWLLRVIGQDAAVLSGGLAAWDGPLETGEVTREPTARAPVPWPAHRFVDADQVAVLATGGGTVLDARAPDRFRGDHEPVDTRAGHVPGARNLPVAALLDEAGRLLPSADLRDRAAAVGALGDVPIAAYCGSGVNACLDLLALETIGVAGRLFPGSWSAWSADPSRDVATGAGPSPRV